MPYKNIEQQKEYRRQWRQAHKEQTKEYVRQWQQAHKEQMKEYYRQYYQAHKEQLNECNRQWRQTHKEQEKERWRQWYQEHKEQKKEYVKRWRKKKSQEHYKKLGEKLDQKQFCKRWKLHFSDAFQKLLDIQENRCAVCGISLEHHQIHVDHDHVTSLVRGLLCWRCNRYRVAQNRSDNIKQVNEYLLNPPAIQLE